MKDLKKKCGNKNFPVIITSYETLKKDYTYIKIIIEN